MVCVNDQFYSNLSFSARLPRQKAALKAAFCLTFCTIANKHFAYRIAHPAESHEIDVLPAATSNLRLL